MSDSHATFSAGGVVLNVQGQILVVNQKHNSWSLPKGHIDPGETLIAAAKREIYEESGLCDLVMIRELGTYQRFKIGKDGVGEDQSEWKTITFFLFRTSEQNLVPVDPENPEARWVNKEDVVVLLTHPKDKEFFLKIKETI
ncbi:MAG: ADP-ribose pyrophosphatase [Candidatus Uhrbacteria bacterium GW2011_GWE2_46_68]|uniref:ADP-ribose pyrophosphatase n=2 Tax=Candidatus Uhriibacteriota TaxID=1752732 RepID=A0A0G1SH06_9BACT|nr:MAG: ADP-ribose pyrophosphatase [Candidatus Uhrbacteria bacterium GW2011_GWF2_46_218]KKU41393.1 MAG: ADP-ribose pyrophosphatase [Candidatus Uhrbacteria bacterium GW2011_GWE2_46_68]